MLLSDTIFLFFLNGAEGSTSILAESRNLYVLQDSKFYMHATIQSNACTNTHTEGAHPWLVGLEVNV